MAYEAPHFGDSADDRESLLPPEGEMPYIDLTLGASSFRLTWQNTLVKRFRIGYGEFDHLLHETDDGLVYLFFSQLDHDGEDDLEELLDKHTFPLEFSPILDEDTIRLYSDLKGKQMADAPPDFSTD